VQIFYIGAAISRRGWVTHTSLSPILAIYRWSLVNYLLPFLWYLKSWDLCTSFSSNLKIWNCSGELAKHPTNYQLPKHQSYWIRQNYSLTCQVANPKDQISTSVGWEWGGGGPGIWTKDFSPGIMALNVEKWWKMLPNMAHFSEDKVV